MSVAVAWCDSEPLTPVTRSVNVPLAVAGSRAGPGRTSRWPPAANDPPDGGRVAVAELAKFDLRIIGTGDTAAVPRRGDLSRWAPSP